MWIRVLVAILGAALTLGAAGCSDNDKNELFKFHIDVDVPQETIPGDAAAAGTELPETTLLLAVDLDDESETHVHSVALIERIRVVELELRAFDPGDDFSFLNRLRVFAISPVDGRQVLVATLNERNGQFVAGNRTLTLRVTNRNLDVFVDDDNTIHFVIELAGVIPDEDVEVDGDAILEIGVVQRSDL